MTDSPEIKPTIRIKPYFRWYDLWVGAYVDTRRQAVYICPLPTIGIKIWRDEIATCRLCGNRTTKAAHHTGDGWILYWDCLQGCLDNEDELIDWPFGDEWLTAADLKHLGYTIN